MFQVDLHISIASDLQEWSVAVLFPGDALHVASWDCISEVCFFPDTRAALRITQ